ncbi:MAG: BON domain-containing protein [Bradyrhizobium sp.]
MINKGLKQNVLDELAWEPGLNAAHVGVTARDGVVTLSGHVESFAEKCLAEHAVGCVSGVRAIVMQLQIHYTANPALDDDIARQAISVLAWDLCVPKDKVNVKITQGWVTLSGEVEWHFQERAAEADIGKLFGVTGVSNDIVINPRVQVSDIEKSINRAFRRNAEFAAENIVVTADGSAVTLTGQVDSYYGRTLASETAWSAPGVTQVYDLLTIG